MPLDEEGALSKQESSDIKAYILTQGTLEFENKTKEKRY